MHHILLQRRQEEEEEEEAAAAAGNDHLLQSRSSCSYVENGATVDVFAGQEGEGLWQRRALAFRLTVAEPARVQLGTTNGTVGAVAAGHVAPHSAVKLGG